MVRPRFDVHAGSPLDDEISLLRHFASIDDRRVHVAYGLGYKSVIPGVVTAAHYAREEGMAWRRTS